MEEKFSVSLELMIQKFKDGAKKAQEVSQNVASKIKENMSVDVGGGAFKGMTAESELLLNKINDIKATLNMAKTDNKLFSKTEVLEMRVELEKLEGQYNKINQSSNMFGASFNKIQDGMKKSLNSAKRFTLSLFGIHSIYRMLSRASSAYLAQDTETSNKIQAAWIGLGSIFAPLLQTIANFAIKAVKYINVFIKALTGTDFLANAMAKSMNKANKSAKGLSKTLAGFDEITNLDTDSAGGLANDWAKAFEDVELSLEWVEKIKEFATKLKKALEPITKAIGEGAKWLYDNVLEPFGKWVGNELLPKFIDTLGQVLKTLGDIISLYKPYFSWLWETFLKPMKDFIADTLISFLDRLNDVLETLSTAIKQIKEGDFRGAGKTIATGIGNGLKDSINDVWKNNNIISKLLSFNFNPVGTIGQTIGEKIGKSIRKFLGLEKAEIKVDANTSKAKSGLSKFFSTLGQTALNVMGLGGILSSIARLDTGTNYVPNDQLAMVHKGEAIIPKKFNSSEYFMGKNNNSDETNSLLRDLIDRVEQIEINPYTTIKDVGTASVDYINKQNRIMGRGVI